ncbi:fimbrillin family protein [Prevotella scopos]|uniref:fimbrillin family protein n=1 Tax=Prevotella scopos TaxID=589437 RepID=UPI000A531FC9|nr:fimbrillin family protein [Prevotella scopos]
MIHFKTYLLCLGLALTTASCSQDDFDSTEATSEKLVDMSFIAGSSQPVTRTVLGTDGSTVTWQANDKIGIGFKGYQPRIIPSPLQPQEVMCISGEKHQMSITYHTS